MELVGFVCDTPARSFLKCCKGHRGFYACERCEVKEASVKNRRRNKKWVYANIYAKSRTNRFFLMQTQREYHNGKSPLLRMTEFDPVKIFLQIRCVYCTSSWYNGYWNNGFLGIIAKLKSVLVRRNIYEVCYWRWRMFLMTFNGRNLI